MTGTCDMFLEMRRQVETGKEYIFFMQSIRVRKVVAAST
jgi:hypothetical protein